MLKFAFCISEWCILTTDPVEQTLLAGDGVGDIGDGVPVERFQLAWWGLGAEDGGFG